MPLPIFDVLLALPTYALVLFRVTGLVLTAPLFSSAVLPARFRAAMVLTTAAVIFPFVRGQAPAELTLSSAIVGGVGELMIGAAIGLSLTIIMMGAEVAGLIIGRQAGIALANVFDPTQNRQISTVGQLFTITLTFVFLLAGGHRAAMAALLDTYDVIPLLSFQVNESILLLLVEMLAAGFILGIRLAGPIVIALFLTSITMGLLSRTMPQLNILTVGFTVRLFAALVLAGFALQACEGILLDAVWDTVELIRSAFGLDPTRTHLVS